MPSSSPGTVQLGALITLGLGVLGLAIQYVRGLIRRSRDEGALAKWIEGLAAKNTEQDVAISSLRTDLAALRSAAEAMVMASRGECTAALAAARRAGATAREAEEHVRELQTAKSASHAELHEKITELAVAVAEIRTRCDSMAEMSGGTDTQGRPRRRCAPGGTES